MLDYLQSHPNLLGLTALILFLTLSVLVTLYIATDRRRNHHRRMEAMALDDETRDTGDRHGD